MMWDTDQGIVAGTTSVAPSPYHTWNIGGAWDHVFNPNLVWNFAAASTPGRWW